MPSLHDQVPGLELDKMFSLDVDGNKQKWIDLFHKKMKKTKQGYCGPFIFPYNYIETTLLLWAKSTLENERGGILKMRGGCLRFLENGGLELKMDWTFHSWSGVPFYLKAPMRN